MVAKWSQPILAPRKLLAQVAELADALDSGSSGRKVVEVRVLSWAPNNSRTYKERLIGSIFTVAENVA